MAVTPGASGVTEPTEAEWADLLNHPWWKGKITQPAASRLLDELGSACQATVFFNRRGQSVTTVGEDVVAFDLEGADLKHGLVRRLGPFKAATVFNAPGERADRAAAYHAVWRGLDDPGHGDRASP